MLKNRKYLSMVVLIIIFSSILVVDLFLNQGIFTAHDIETNLIYFGSFYSSLVEGNFIPRWSANVANLYGSPTSMFFYPFSYYLASPIHALGFSLINTMKIFIFITFIASSVFMYLWLKKHVSDLAAAIGGLLYVYAPYRINDVYARGSVAENTAFVFLPLVAIALYNLWEKPDIKRVITLSIVSSALILSHPFILVVFLPFYFLYVIFLKLNLEKIKLLFLSGLLTFGLTAFYTLPLVKENKYTHYDISPFNGSGYYKQFVSVKQLILPIWTFIDAKGKLEYQTYQIGLLQIALFVVSVIIISRVSVKDDKVKKLFFVSIISFTVSIFLMLSYSDFVYKVIPFLQRIEFPWRYLSLNLFSLAVVSSVAISLIKEKLQKSLVVAIIIIGMFLYLPHSKGHDYKIVRDDYYLYNIRENTDGFATLPRWAAQPDIYPRIDNRYEVVDGKATVEILKRTGRQHLYNVKADVEFMFADATFYLPGWQVYIDNKPAEIEFQNPDYRGIITFKVPRGEHFVEVVFGQTKLRKLADFITLLSIVAVFILYKYGEKIQKNINSYTGVQRKEHN